MRSFVGQYILLAVGFSRIAEEAVPLVIVVPVVASQNSQPASKTRTNRP